MAKLYSTGPFPIFTDAFGVGPNFFGTWQQTPRGFELGDNQTN